MSQRIVVGIDIGHSEVKVSSHAGQFSFPSFACPAVRITDETEAKRAAAETVMVGEKEWFIGETAIIQSSGILTSGLTDEWIETPEHSALLAGAFKKLAQRGINLSGAMIVLGLPSRLHQRQKARLRELARELVNAEFKVLPQPIGPYYAYMLDAKGAPIADRPITQMSWAVVDVGYYTTDFLLMMKGRWVESVKDSAKGVHVAAQNLQRILRDRDIDTDLAECERAIQTKTVRHFGTQNVSEEVQKATSLVVSEVADASQRLLNQLAGKLDGILVAGGGAYLIADTLKSKWRTAILADNPRYSVCEGFRRFGLGLMLAKGQAVAA